MTHENSKAVNHEKSEIAPKISEIQSGKSFDGDLSELKHETALTEHRFVKLEPMVKRRVFKTESKV